MDFLIPGYIKKVIQKNKHEMSKRPQKMPYPVAPIKYGKGAQDSFPEETSREASEEEVLKVQQVVGRIMYYAVAVDMMALMSLSTISSEQVKATYHTIKTIEQLSDYMASNPDATMIFRTSDMILNIYSDMSYPSVLKGMSRA